MPGQKAKSKAPVHVSIDRDRIATAKERLAAEGRTLTDLVDHALAEYGAGRLTLPALRSRPDGR